MRLFVSDSFFDKFVELPRNIQQKARDFQKKFRENSQSSAIHLESITQFKDSTLRSARVDQEYRAILGSLGKDNYMLLYIDKHDLAYRWAQNKKFVWNEYTQCGQIIPVSIEENIEPEVCATEQEVTDSSAWEGVTDETLLQIGVPKELIALVRSIKDLDDLDQAESKLPQDTYENIFAFFDGVSIKEILEEIEEGKAKYGEDSLLSNNNKRRFVEITDDEYLAQIMEEGMEKWRIFLHPSQSKLVEAEYKGTVKVSGSAGTGKTIAAVHRLKKLAERPNAYVLFTTYTKALLSNLKTELVSKMGIDSRKYELNNIDRVLLDVAKANGVLPLGWDVLDYSGDNKSKALWREVLDNEVTEFDEEFLYAEYIDVILYNNNKELKDYLVQSRAGRSKALSRKQRVEIWKLTEKYEAIKQERKKMDRLELFNKTANYLKENGVHPYTNVIVDEFQDFSNPELRFLRALVEDRENDLFLVGDPFQRVYNGRKINFTSAGINVKGKRSRKLKVNYRTTEEIKRIAVSVIKGEKYDDLDSGEENNKGYISLVHGEKPAYKVFETSDDEVKHVLDYIAQVEYVFAGKGISMNNVCIASRTKRGYKDIQDALHREGHKYGVLEGGDVRGDKNGVSLCTFHSLKGLEFRIVILVGVNEQMLPSREAATTEFERMDAAEKKEYLSHIRSLLYVAITRARQNVLITGYGEPTGLLEITK